MSAMEEDLTTASLNIFTVPKEKERKCSLQKEGVVFYEIAVRLKALWPKAAVHIHKECNLLCTTMENYSPDLLLSKLSPERNGSEEDR